jgi:hypothetical protein
MRDILNNIEEVRKLDSKSMLGSLELLSAQVEEVLGCAKNLKIPASYKKVKILWCLVWVGLLWEPIF